MIRIFPWDVKWIWKIQTSHFVVQSLSCVLLFVTPELQHARLPWPSPTPGACSNSCPLSRWCHPTISSSAVPFSSCPQSFPASGSFPKSEVFAWGGQSIGASASVLFCIQFSSVQFSRSVMSNSLRPHESQHARPPCPSPTPGVHSDSRPSS